MQCLISILYLLLAVACCCLLLVVAAACCSWWSAAHMLYNLEDRRRTFWQGQLNLDPLYQNPVESVKVTVVSQPCQALRERVYWGPVNLRQHLLSPL
jgi:hypothetical protein